MLKYVLAADYETYEGKVGKLAGWGTLEEGGKPACILRMVDVPIISHEKCVSRYPSGMVTPNMMCAGYDEGQKDSCQVIACWNFIVVALWSNSLLRWKMKNFSHDLVILVYPINNPIKAVIRTSCLK